MQTLEERNAYRAKWRESHREETRAKSRAAYRKLHPNARINGNRVLCLICGLKPPASKCSYCKPCRKEKERLWREQHPEEHKARVKLWRDQNSEKRRAYELQRVHGITEADYQKQFAEQNGVCAICKQPPKNGKKLFVDHNHQTEQRRGLLCMECNFGIGFFKENSDILQAAIEYVNFWQCFEAPSANFPPPICFP